MRSFLPVAVLLFVLASFCIIYTNASESFVSDMYAYTEQLEKNQFSNLKNVDLLQDLENTFLKKEPLFSPFMNHDILEETKNHILRAKLLFELGNEDLFRLEIRTLKTHLGDIIDEQKANFSNILKKE